MTKQLYTSWINKRRWWITPSSEQT